MLNKFYKRLRRGISPGLVYVNAYIARVTADLGTLSVDTQILFVLYNRLLATMISWTEADELSVTHQGRVLTDSGGVTGYLKLVTQPVEDVTIAWYEADSLALRDSHLARVVADSGSLAANGYFLRQVLESIDSVSMDVGYLDSDAYIQTLAHRDRVVADSGSFAALYEIRRVLTPLEETIIAWS